MEHANMTSARPSISLTGESRGRIQRKQEKELDMLRHLKQQTKANKIAQQKAHTAPATPLKDTHPLGSPDQSWIHESVKDKLLAHDIESLQSRLRELQPHQDTRGEVGTQTSVSDRRKSSEARIETPPPSRRQGPIGWSDLFDAIISSNSG